MVAGTAVADSSKQQIPVTCGSSSFTVWVNGNGDFTPAHRLGSTSVFIPHYFSPVDGVIKDTHGTAVGTFHEDALVKGSGKQKGDTTCSYTFSFTSDGSDPGGPPAGYTFSGSGTVTGKWTG